MFDLSEFWHAGAAVLLVLWARREPAWQARFGKREASLAIAGALLPLLDDLMAALFAPDWIEFLTRTRWMHSVPMGALSITAASLLAAFATGFRRAASALLWIAAGWSGHLALDLLTPSGIELGVPEDPAPFDWPAFAAGHGALILLLAVALVAIHVKPAWFRWTRLAAWSLLGAYLAGGVVQFAVVYGRAAALAQAGHGFDVVPDSIWRTRWRVVLTGGSQHEVGELSFWGGTLTEPSPLPRGNDEARLLTLLADPVVRRFYFRVFRNPVAQVDETPAQVSLTLREASDLDAGKPGAAFMFETGLDGRERVYHVERFN